MTPSRPSRSSSLPPTLRDTFFHCLYALALLHACLPLALAHPSHQPNAPAPLHNERRLDWSYGQSAETSYIFTNHHWWETPDHQMTSIITLLALAHNASSIPVIPTVASPSLHRRSNNSLLGHYFDLSDLLRVQPALTFADFLQSEDYALLRRESTRTVPLPKNSQEEYETKLALFGRLQHSAIHVPLPAVDPEHTGQFCDTFPGTIHLSPDRKKRFIFLDRIHFFHFCAERFLPWWYDVRHRIAPKKPYFDVANRFLAARPRPISAVHITDVMESQKNRDSEEIERYARQIVDALRRNQAIAGSMYIIGSQKGANVNRVVSLLQQEFENVHNCSHLFSCLERVPRDIFEPALSDDEYDALFQDGVGLRMVEWALSSQTDLFIGNIHSPYSRNICLHRKTHGKPYAVLKGFGELRKVWSWSLRRR